MKKILLLSDTHGYIDDEIVDFASKADEVWHAGDIGSFEVVDRLAKVSHLRAVWGNIDDAKMRVEYPEHQQLFCEKVSVWMTHIGGYPGRYAIGIKEKMEVYLPQLFICGHSHILKVMRDKRLNILHMNPGSVGKYGFHKIRTMLRFEIAVDEIKNLEVIELAKR